MSSFSASSPFIAASACGRWGCPPAGEEQLKFRRILQTRSPSSDTIAVTRPFLNTWLYPRLDSWKGRVWQLIRPGLESWSLPSWGIWSRAYLLKTFSALKGSEQSSEDCWAYWIRSCTEKYLDPGRCPINVSQQLWSASFRGSFRGNTKGCLQRNLVFVPGLTYQGCQLWCWPVLLCTAGLIA